MDQGVEAFHLPRDDVNAPDMYIPAMAFITYMLLVGLALGQRSVFTPEVLGLTSSKAAAVVLAEVLAIKASFYILNIPGEVVVLDLIAYMGYKFVGYVCERRRRVGKRAGDRLGRAGKRAGNRLGRGLGRGHGTGWEEGRRRVGKRAGDRWGRGQ